MLHIISYLNDMQHERKLRALGYIEDVYHYVNEGGLQYMKGIK